MGPHTQRLIRVLGELAEVLENNGEPHWRAWMLKARSRLEASDLSGIEYLLSAYGGMGSFNDVALGQSMDGAVSTMPNERLDSLRSEAWTLAQYIKKNHEVSDA